MDVDEIVAGITAFETASPTLGPYFAWAGLVCARWPVPPAFTRLPVTAPGAAPILVVGTTGDMATPYEWAQSLAAQLESGGRTAYRRGSDCIDDAVDAYLIDGAVPDDGHAL